MVCFDSICRYTRWPTSLQRHRRCSRRVDPAAFKTRSARFRSAATLEKRCRNGCYRSRRRGGASYWSSTPQDAGVRWSYFGTAARLLRTGGGLRSTPTPAAARGGLEVLGQPTRGGQRRRHTAAAPQKRYNRAKILRAEIDKSDSDWDRESLASDGAKLAGGCCHQGGCRHRDRTSSERSERSRMWPRRQPVEDISPVVGASLIHQACAALTDPRASLTGRSSVFSEALAAKDFGSPPTLAWRLGGGQQGHELPAG